MKKTIFTGAGVAIVTPMRGDGAIDYERLRELINLQIAEGTDAIVICGTTGESSTMSDEEHVQTIRCAVECVRGRAPVIAGAGSNDTAYSVWMSKQAKEAGADALLQVTPYYNKTSQKGLMESFHYIANCVELPCILYNVPSRTGCNILPATYLALSKNPYIVATKEANGDTASVARTIALCGDDLAVYSGEDNQALAITALGGKGVISVFSNALPKQMHDLVCAAAAGQLTAAQQLNNQYIDLMDGFFMDVNPIPIKEALWQMGVISTNFCRMPLTTMPEEKQAAMTALLKKHGLI